MQSRLQSPSNSQAMARDKQRQPIRGETRVPDRWFQKVACRVKLVEKRYMVLLLVIAFIANRLPWLIVVCIMTLTLKVKVVPFKMH